METQAALGVEHAGIGRLSPFEEPGPGCMWRMSPGVHVPADYGSELDVVHNLREFGENIDHSQSLEFLLHSEELQDACSSAPFLAETELGPPALASFDNLGCDVESFSFPGEPLGLTKGVHPAVSLSSAMPAPEGSACAVALPSIDSSNLGQSGDQNVSWHHAARFAKAGKQEEWNAWNEDWKKAGSLSKLRSRLSSSRIINRRGNSCTACRQVKKKCDGCAPCGRCQAKGLPCSLAVNNEPDSEPVPSVICFAGVVNYNGTSLLAKAQSDPLLNLPYQKLNQLCLMRRLPRGPIKKMFNNMTPYLLDTISHIMSCLPTFQGPPPGAFLQTRVEPASALAPILAEASFPACVLEMSMDQTQGFISTNQAFAAGLGMHSEELLARTLAGERPYPQTELRLFTILFVMLRKRSPLESETWYIATNKRGSPCYLRMTFNNQIRMTERGPKIKMTGSIVYLSVEEYKDAVISNPNICDSLGLPFLTEMPDNKAETFEDLSKSEKGRQRMDLLAGKLRDLFKEYFF